MDDGDPTMVVPFLSYVIVSILFGAIFLFLIGALAACIEVILDKRAMNLTILMLFLLTLLGLGLSGKLALEFLYRAIIM